MTEATLVAVCRAPRPVHVPSLGRETSIDKTATAEPVAVGLLGPPLNGKGNESVVRARQDRLLNDLTICIDVVDVEVRQANLLAAETN